MDIITRYNQVLCEISRLEAAPVDVDAVLAGEPSTQARVADLRRALKQMQAAYDVAIAERRTRAEAERAQAEAEANTRTALAVIDQRLAQLDQEQAAALEQFGRRRTELERERRRILGNLLPGDIPSPQPDDVVYVLIPEGVDERGLWQSQRSVCMTVREAKAKGYAPRYGWQ